MDQYADVVDFHRRFDQPRFGWPLTGEARTARFKHIEEELEELRSAETREDFADALVDLVYVVIGTAVVARIPFDRVWKVVHEANMRKVPAMTERSPWDVVKPDGWIPPDVAAAFDGDGRATWDEVYLGVCRAFAARSRYSTKVGAAVADDKNALVSAGFNGPPRTAFDPRVPDSRPEVYGWHIHAEANAILFALAARGSYMLGGCTLYTTAFPCSRCALLAAQVKVQRVVHGDTVPLVCDEADRGLTVSILQECGIELRRAV